jgi:zinc/manganese transport system permease protein
VNAFELSILAPALAAGLLVLATHVALGQEVLRRGIIFIDLAIAQVAGLGVIAADTMGWEPHGWRVQAAAVGAALGVAVILNWTGRRWHDVQEALIGAAFILAATAGILILAGNPHGGEHLKELLVGQILWVTPEQLIPVALLYALCLVAWFAFPQRMRGFGFYGMFALVVTASVQLVGVYLVFASLIVPALATRHIPGRGKRYLWGYLIGAAGYLLGLALSMRWDLPPGAIIAWALAMFAVAFSWLAPARVRG